VASNAFVICLRGYTVTALSQQMNFQSNDCCIVWNLFENSHYFYISVWCH